MGKKEKVIAIETVRDVVRRAGFSSGAVPRVVAIYHADAFTREAANAFLKTLEEPSSHIIFFLLADSRAGLLPTILSRVWTVRFSCPKPSFEHREIFGEKRTENLGKEKLGFGQEITATFFQKPLFDRFAITEKLAKRDDHGKQFIADLITHLRQKIHTDIKKSPHQNVARGEAEHILPQAMEAYELLHLPGAPHRLILDTLASYEANR